MLLRLKLIKSIAKILSQLNISQKTQPYFSIALIKSLIRFYTRLVSSILFKRVILPTQSQKQLANIYKPKVQFFIKLAILPPNSFNAVLPSKDQSFILDYLAIAILVVEIKLLNQLYTVLILVTISYRQYLHILYIIYFIRLILSYLNRNQIYQIISLIAVLILLNTYYTALIIVLIVLRTAQQSCLEILIIKFQNLVATSLIKLITFLIPYFSQLNKSPTAILILLKKSL